MPLKPQLPQLRAAMAALPARSAQAAPSAEVLFLEQGFLVRYQKAKETTRRLPPALGLDAAQIAGIAIAQDLFGGGGEAWEGDQGDKVERLLARIEAMQARIHAKRQEEKVWVLETKQVACQTPEQIIAALTLAEAAAKEVETLANEGAEFDYYGGAYIGAA